jgi:hypothetical protein
MKENNYFLEDNVGFLLFDTLFLSRDEDFTNFEMITNHRLIRTNQESIFVFKSSWLKEYYFHPLKEIKYQFQIYILRPDQSNSTLTDDSISVNSLIESPSAKLFCDLTSVDYCLPSSEKLNILQTQRSDEEIFHIAHNFPPDFMKVNNFFVEDSFHYLLFDTLFLQTSEDFVNFQKETKVQLLKTNQESIMIYKSTWMEDYYTQPMKELERLYSKPAPNSPFEDKCPPEKAKDTH